MHTTNWQLVIDFLSYLIPRINVGEDATHVGAVSFGKLGKHYFSSVSVGYAQSFGRRLDRVSRKYSLNVDKTKVMASEGVACRILIQNDYRRWRVSEGIPDQVKQRACD